jgi:hypothetical protein
MANPIAVAKKTFTEDDVKQAKTKIALRANLTIDEKPVPIIANLGDGAGFTLFLRDRARLGTPISFVQWAKTTFQADVPLLDVKFSAAAKNDKKKQEDELKAHLADKVPGPLLETLAKALLVEIWLDALAIDTSNKAFTFGMTLDFAAGAQGLAVLPNITLDQLGFRITRAPDGYAFPEPPKMLPVPQLVATSGSDGEATTAATAETAPVDAGSQPSQPPTPPKPKND